MGVMKGSMTVRRFRVVGNLPDGWRTLFRDRLNEHAFREPPARKGKEEVSGWTQIHNLLETSFDDEAAWLYEDTLLFALRTDKVVLPGALFRATVDQRCKAWCAVNGVERTPAARKKAIAEELEEEWLKRALPRVNLVELCWNVDGGYLLLSSLSEKVGDDVRKRFQRTFGLALVPWSPLDAVDNKALQEAFLSTNPSLVAAPSQAGADA